MSVQTMSALAPVENQRPLVSPPATLHELAANSDVPTWELHSELVLVCPETIARTTARACSGCAADQDASSDCPASAGCRGG